MIRQLKSKDRVRFIEFLKEFKDEFFDNYITTERERHFFDEPKIAQRIFNKIMRHGDKCIVLEQNNDLKGLLIITGFSDHFFRKYVKCLSKNLTDANLLFRFFGLNYNGEYFMKLKSNNPLCEIITLHGFYKTASRGKENLYMKEKNND